MGFELVSDKPVTELTEFLLSVMNELERCGAEKVGVFAVLPGGETFQAYHDMGFGDKLLMSGHVQMDAVDVMITNNQGRYFDYDG